MTKKNKKNWVVRALSLTLLFTLISGCLMSGTLARYVTSSGKGPGDTARVAKWGVHIESTDTLNLFDDVYATKEGNEFTYTEKYSVDSKDGENVLAPGTEKNSAAGAKIYGEPEVACNIAIKFDEIKADGWKAIPEVKWENGKYVEDTDKSKFEYDPVIWTWKLPGMDAKKSGSFSQLKAAIEKNDSTFSFNVDPNEDLSKIDNLGFDISWEWKYQGDITMAPYTNCGTCGFCTGTNTSLTECQNPIGTLYTPEKRNELDTKLGNAATLEGFDLGFDLGYSITITQID